MQSFLRTIELSKESHCNSPFSLGKARTSENILHSMAALSIQCSYWRSHSSKSWKRGRCKGIIRSTRSCLQKPVDYSISSCSIYTGVLTIEEDDDGSLAGSGSAIESPLRNMGNSVTESLSSRILRSNSLGFAVSQ